jgi:hypothetical protein
MLARRYTRRAQCDQSLKAGIAPERTETGIDAQSGARGHIGRALEDGIELRKRVLLIAGDGKELCGFHAILGNEEQRVMGLPDEGYRLRTLRKNIVPTPIERERPPAAEV